MSELPVNKPATLVNRILHGLIFGVAISGARAAAVAGAPWLKLPFLSQLLDLVLNFVGKRIYLALAESSTFLIIDWQTEAQQKEYDKAVGDLKGAIDQGDPDAVKKAQEEFMRRLKDLVNFDGGAKP